MTKSFYKDLYNNDAINKFVSGSTRPSEDIRPELKSKQPHYAMAWLKYIYGSHVNGETGIPYNQYSRIDYLRAYADGRQSTSTYKDRFAIEEGQSQPQYTVSVDQDSGSDSDYARQSSRSHYMDVDFEKIFSPASKYLNNVIGRLIKRDMDVSVEAIDEVSGYEKKWKKFSTYVKSVNKEFVDGINEMRGVEKQPGMDEAIAPKSLEELNILENLGAFKSVYEVSMEKALRFTSEISKEHEIKKQVYQDILTINMGSYMSLYDSYDGIVKYKYIDPKDLIIEYARKYKFDKSGFFGYVMDFTISELRDKLPNVSEDELAGLAQNNNSLYGNPGKFTPSFNEDTGVYNYDHYHIPVLFGRWKATDSFHYMERVGKNGERIKKLSGYNKDGSPRIENGKNRKTYCQYLQTIYEGYWLIGTEHVFGYGKMVNIPFDFKKREPTLGIACYRGESKSIVENMVPMLDQIQMTYLRLQNAIAKAPPSGLKIDIGKMKGMNIGGNKWNPLDLIKLYTHTGHMLYDSSVGGGNINPSLRTSDPGKAIEELKGGVGSAISDAAMSFEMSFNAIAELTGIDRASSVGSQDPRTSAAETKIAAAGTSDTLFSIIDSWAALKKDASNAAALMIQSACIGNPEPYHGPIGKDNTKILAAAAGNPPIYMGIVVRPGLTDEEQVEIKTAAQAALKAGILKYSEYLFVTDKLRVGGNMNYAQAYLAYKEREAEERQSETAQRNEQANTEKLVAMEQSKQQGKMQENQQKSDLQIREDINKADQEIRINNESVKNEE